MVVGIIQGIGLLGQVGRNTLVGEPGSLSCRILPALVLGISTGWAGHETLTG